MRYVRRWGMAGALMGLLGVAVSLPAQQAERLPPGRAILLGPATRDVPWPEAGRAARLEMSWQAPAPDASIVTARIGQARIPLRRPVTQGEIIGIYVVPPCPIPGSYPIVGLRDAAGTMTWHRLRRDRSQWDREIVASPCPMVF